MSMIGRTAAKWRRILSRWINPPIHARPESVPPPGATTMDVETLLDELLRREGGYVNHPSDRGGPTKYGITISTLRAWRDAPVMAGDVAHLSETEARAIYRTEYYDGPRIDQLPPEVQPVVFDAAVNHGPGAAVRMLQESVNAMSDGPRIDQDGQIGPETLGALAGLPSDSVVASVVERRRRFYRSLAANDRSQRVFLQGWLARMDEFDGPVG
jgi:lysozyme family protein